MVIALLSVIALDFGSIDEVLGVLFSNVALCTIIALFFVLYSRVIFIVLHKEGIETVVIEQKKRPVVESPEYHV